MVTSRWTPWCGLLALGASGACRVARSTPTDEHAAVDPLQPRPPGYFVWHELIASDPRAEVAFYEDVVGWRARVDSDRHTTLVGDFGDVAGVSEQPAVLHARGAPSLWIGRVAVADVDATAAQARAHGGQVVVEPVDLPGYRFAILQDPDGSLLQIATASKPRPSDAAGRQLDDGREGEDRRTGRVLSEFAWDELATPDGDGMFRFYGAVFDWTTVMELPLGSTGKYRMLGRMGVPTAGIAGDPGMHEQGWVGYAQVRDLDAALGRATQRGGAIVVGPISVPDGRMVQLRDPQGAVFGLRESVRVENP